MSNNKLLKGTFILAFSGLFAKFLGVFFKIPLQRLIGDEGMGLFGLPYPLYIVMLSISITGFPAAISKLISEKLALGDRRSVNKIFTVSFIILLSIGLFTSGFLYFGAKYIIKVLEWPSESYYSIIGLSFAPFFVSIMSAFRGYFQGMQIMVPTAVSQVVEQIGRVLFGVGLAYTVIYKGIGYAAGAASFGASIGSVMGVFVLLIYYFAHKSSMKSSTLELSKEERYKEQSAYEISKEIIYLAIPISISGLLSSVMTLIDAVMVPARLINNGYTMEQTTILYGQLTGKAVTLMNVPLTFSVAMAASLIPAIAQSYSKNKMGDIRKKISSSIKITIIIALPATLGLFILAPQIIHLLWGKGELGGDILRILSLNVIFISLGQILGSILQGINKVFIPLRNLIIGIILKVCISYYLLGTNLNILGGVIGSIIGYFVVMVLNYIEVKKHTKFKLEIKNSIIKPFIASISMMVGIIYIYPYIYFKLASESISTIITILVGAIIYALAIYISEALDLK